MVLFKSKKNKQDKLEQDIKVEKLSKAIKWTSYITIVISFLVFIIIPGIVCLIQPSFFPKLDISGFEKCLTIGSIIIGCVSLGLGLYSIVQSRKGEQLLQGNLKETQTVLHELYNIERLISDDVSSFTHKTVVETNKDVNTKEFWCPDKSE